MARLRCECGNIISNNYSPSKTVGILCGQIDAEALQRKIENTIEDYILSVREGKESDWVRSYFKNECTYGPSAVIASIMSDYELRYHREVLECSDCGAIFIAKGADSCEFEIYAPKSGEYNSVLNCMES